MNTETPHLTKEETFEYKSQQDKILKIVRSSLYTNKDVFLRELISNACDACNKLRYESITNPALIEEDSYSPEILVTFDEKSITILDNGIGMSRDELINNLGTIAKSGTEEFIENIGQNENSKEMIGQFGVGFYSAFMIAENVIVTSKKAGSKEVWQWQSSYENNKFSVSESEEQMSAGTKIQLILTEEEKDYLNKFTLQNIIERYSDNVNCIIKLKDDKGVEEQINSGVAIWKKNKNEVSEAEHKEFFRNIAHVGGDPWITLHNKHEGIVEFTNLLYIPSIKPFDLYNPERRCSVKLYVRGVFVAEENLDLVPKYMRFVKGVVDAENIPLNISRETIQHHSQINKIKSSLVKNITSTLKKKKDKETESYIQFANNFLPVLKEGLCEAIDVNTRENLLELCLFQTTKSKGSLIDIKTYVENMKEGQDAIYFMIGDHASDMIKSPKIEGFISKDIEVLLLTDDVDNFWTTVVTDYKNTKIRSISSEDIDLESIEKKDEEKDSNKNVDEKTDNKSNEDVCALVEYIKETLDKKISNARISKKLTTSPVCLSIPGGSFDARMEKFLIEQKQLAQRTAKILEVNSKHQTIIKLAKALKEQGKSEDLANKINFLYDSICVAEGEPISDTQSYFERSIKVIDSLL